MITARDRRATDILTKEYGLSRQQLDDLTWAGDDCVDDGTRPLGPLLVHGDYIWNEVELEVDIVEAILARIDKLEAAEAGNEV